MNRTLNRVIDIEFINTPRARPVPTVETRVSPTRLLLVSTLVTVVTTIVLGLGYPLLVTVLAQLLFPLQANGVGADGRIGSDLIGQPFSSPGYFWSRPSAAGQGYDAGSSGGSNLGPTNRRLIERVQADVRRLQATNAGMAVPIDLVTTSASGLDPHISPAAAAFQVRRVARERAVDEASVRKLVADATEDRQFGVLGEPRVNVLRLNVALDARFPMHVATPRTIPGSHRGGG